jgi:cytochrome c553
MTRTAHRKSKSLFLNITFLAFCVAILIFLYNAPEETTAKLPKDADHSRFQDMKKKEAEKFCSKCHNPEGVSPLPQDHPPKYRCLFCHKRI